MSRRTRKSKNVNTPARDPKYKGYINTRRRGAKPRVVSE